MLACKTNIHYKCRDSLVFKVIPADRAIWNQNELIDFLIEHQHTDIVLSTNNEGPDCAILGLYTLLDKFNFKSVSIHTANPLEKSNKYNIISKSLLWAQVRKPIDAKYHTWTQDRVFSAYYGRPLWHRMGLASHLKTQHNDISYVNLRGDYQLDESRRTFELTDLFFNAPDQLLNFSNISSQLPLMVETIDGYTPGVTDTSGFTDQLVEFYTKVLIDIVAETFTSGNTFFPTEKTFRPILMKKPFIVMGPINYLIYLRQMGFKTFFEYWDEEYDGYGPRIKFQKIIKLIDDLSSKSKSELYSMYQSMQPILEHNYNLLVSKTYNRNIKLVNDK